MKLFVKTLSKQAECRKYSLFFFLIKGYPKGQTGMITGHLRLFFGELCTNCTDASIYKCVCVRECVSPITLPAAGILRIKDSTVRWPAEAGG